MKTLVVLGFALLSSFASAEDITHDVLTRGDIGKIFSFTEANLLNRGFTFNKIETIFDNKSRYGRPVPMAQVTYCPQTGCLQQLNVMVQIRVDLIEVPPPPTKGGGFSNVYGEPLSIHVGPRDLM